ncbi:redoxin domain-containing protein [Oceanobacillus alkalisoli]|uniref:redoxin domain-containing protein n=1 Tax=Oceanobacillus alkalisoli TaxID=2925113 RepID=UPI001EEF80C8|nr:redoxin domain-containing protein [Oceanobacillus alkalisoli]MCF3943030.1 redoxin domain-containing protein [Oceanobacillus alkalisoli]MCG5104196.1 redoxin domain-containing protein [Oceanobacillus alkalisoli]
MKKLILIIVFVLMFGWAVYEFVGDSDSAAIEEVENTSTAETSAEEGASVSSNIEVDESSGKEGLDLGDMAPDVKLKTLEGEEVQLSDFRGERVMLNFWGTWCPPCRAEMPDMEKFHQNTDIKIVAVNLIETETSLDDVHEFIDDFGLTFSVYTDEGNAATEAYRIQPIPTSYLINSDGTIHNKAFGALNYELMIQEFEKMK